MASPSPTDSAFDAEPESFENRPPPRIRRSRRRKRMRPATRYAVGLAALIVLAIAIQFLVHTARTDPRDSRAIAERELRVNTLEPGERVIRQVSVFKRPAIDYFRATRGLLALTNRRLLYLGLEPRDLLAAPDLPPTFEERDFPLDTSVRVTSGRTFFGIAKAIVITTPHDKTKLGVPSGVWPEAGAIIAGMDTRYHTAAAAAVRQRQFLAQAEAQRRAAEAERKKAKYYTVRRGDALGSIATMWNTTTDRLRDWNHLPGNNIRAGQVLLVRPAID
jgi:LysM repeat protein